MSAVPAALLAELASASAQVFWSLELGSNALRYAEGEVASAGRGHHQGRILSLSTIERALSDRRYSLEANEVSVTLADHDQVLAREIAGYGASPTLERGSAALVRLCSPRVSPSSWHTAWTGVIDTFDMTKPHVWQLRLRPNDLPLQNEFPRPEWTITRAEWPHAKRDVYDHVAPIIYGRHDSVGTTATGAVPLYRVDGSRLRYLVAAGVLKSVDRLYVDEISQASGWCWAAVTINGRSYTVVTFTTDPGEDANVTADVQGLTSVGDGSGSLFTDPVDQLLNLLNNFVWGAWQSGAWIGHAAPYDSASFDVAKAFLAACSFGGYKGSRRIAARTRGEDAVNDWCASFAVYAYWTDGGQLALAVDDHRVGTAYVDTPWFRPEDLIAFGDPGEDLEMPFDVANLTDRVAVAFMPVGGQPQETLQVRDQAIQDWIAQTGIAPAWARATAL